MPFVDRIWFFCNVLWPTLLPEKPITASSFKSLDTSLAIALKVSDQSLSFEWEEEDLKLKYASGFKSRVLYRFLGDRTICSKVKGILAKFETNCTI